MSFRRGVMLVGVALIAAAVTVGAGLAGLRRGAVDEAKVVSVGEGMRFEWVDVVVRGDAAVGAWQVEVRGTGDVKFVGVEGEGGAEPPVYDAAALAGGGRLVIGGIKEHARSKGAPPALAEPRAVPPLGAGELEGRVARVHLQVSGRAEIVGALVALGDPEGKRIGGTVELVRGGAK